MLKKYSNFCPVPWTQIATTTSGDQRMCCMMDRDNGIDLPHGKFIYTNNKKLTVRDGITSYLNSDSVQLIKDSLVNNKMPNSCECYHNEEILSNNTEKHISKRITSLNHHKLLTDEDVEEFLKKEHLIDYYDIRIGNNCNLQCVMCSPSLSNQLYEQDLYINDFRTINVYGVDVKKENNKIVIDLAKEKEVYGWANDQFFIDLENIVSKQIEKNPDKIITFYILGGEPLLNKPHFKFLENLYKKGYAKSIGLEYNTNMTVSDNEILNLWTNFHLTTLALSIDDIEDRYEYIRYPAKWSKILSNLSELETFVKSRPDVFRAVNFVSVINLFTIDNYSNTEAVAKSFGLGSGKLIGWGPKGTTPAVLTKNEKDKFLNFIPNDHNFEEIKKYLYSFEFNQEDRDRFFKLLSFWESRRRKSFNKTFINLASVLGI